MKTCLFLLLLLGGCASEAVTSPMPVLGTTNAVVSPMPDFPAPIASIRATNASSMPYRDFLPQDATEYGSNAYQNGSRAKEHSLALRSKINTNEVQRQAIIADRVMLHNLYVQATNGDEHAKMNYHLLRTNEAFMSRLTNSASR